MSGGLKDQWGVDDPAKVASDKQSQDFFASFRTASATINGDLQYTAGVADPARHDPLAARRDSLYPAFQSALDLVDPADATKAKPAIDKVLTDAGTLSTDAATLHKD